MKQFLSVTAGAAVLAFAAAANAAPCTVGDCEITGGPLTLTDGVSIGSADAPLGPVDDQGSFGIGADVTHADTVVDIAFDQIFPGESSVRAGFANLTIEFFQDTTSLGSFVVTGADGLFLLQTFTFNLISNSDVFFEIAGTAFRNQGNSLPDYNFDLIGTPIPAALPLLLSGIAGLAFAARRPKSR